MAIRAARIAGISLTVILTLIVLAVGILYGLASSDTVRDWALEKAKTELAAGPGLTLQIGSVQGGLLSTLKFQNLSIGHKGRKFFQVKEVELGFELLPLLGGRLRVKPLRLEEPDLTLPLELGSAGDEETGPMPLAVSVTNIEIVNGRVRAPQGEWGPLRSVEGINAKGGFVFDLRGARAQLDLRQARLEMPKGAFEVSAKANLRNQRLELDELVIKSRGAELKSKGWLALSDGFSFKLITKGRLANYELLPIAWPGTQLPQAPLDFNLSAAGKPEQCRIIADLNLAGGRVESRGVMNLTVPDGRFEIDFDKFDPHAWGFSPQSIQASGRAEVASQGRPGHIDQKAEVNLVLSQLSVLKVKTQRLELKAGLEAGVVQVNQLEAAGNWGSLQGGGTLRLPHAGKSFEMDAKLSFKNLTAPQALSGELPAALRSPRLNGSLETKGNLNDLNFALELDSSGLAKDISVDSLNAVGGLRDGAWRLNHFEAKGAWGDIRAQGSLDGQEVDLKFDLQMADLAIVCEALNLCGIDAPKVGGALKAKGMMSGRWPAPQWELNASAQDMAGFETFLKKAEITARGGSLNPLKGKVVLLANDLASGEEFWEKIRLELSSGRVVYDFNLQAHSYDGWDLSISADSPIESPFFQAITLRRFRMQKPGQAAWVQKDAATLAISQDGMFLKGLNLKAGDQSVSISGGWQGRDNVEADLEVSNLLIKPLLKENVLPPDTILNASAKLSGGLDQPVMSLRGKLTGLVWSGLPPSQVEFSGSYQEETLELNGRALTDGHPSLNFTASLGLELSLHPPVSNLTAQRLSASAKSDNLPLALFEPLVPGLAEISGRANMNITATGSLEKPIFSGFVELDQAGFTVSPTGQRFEKIDLALGLEGQRVSVQRAKVQSGGAMEFSGWFDLPRAEGGRFSMDMKASKFDLSIGIWGDSKFDAALQARGTWQEPLITGTVKPTDLRVQIGVGPPSALAEEVVVLKPGEKPPPLDRQPRSLKWVPGGILGRAKVDLGADLGKGLKVSLDDGWLIAAGGMHLKKEPKGPFTYHGVINVDRGLVLLLGKRFNILKGKLDFAGRDEPNPIVDATVTLTAGKILARISVSGDANNPHVQISSEPPMNQADILSTIVFGRPAQNLDQGQSDQLSAQALALLGQRGAQEIGQLLSPQLAPDVVTVYQEAQYGSSLEAGKYLSPDLYLRYRHNLSSEGGQNVGLEYHINNWLSIESQVGDARDSGVDVIYSFDFD